MSEAVRFYQRMREVMGVSRHVRRTPVPAERPFGPGRDPHTIADALGEVGDRLGWTGVLAEHEIFAQWSALVGPEVAEHSEPVSLNEGVLTVRCTSTAWATQLRILAGDVQARLLAAVPDAKLSKIRFLGPDAPTWKKGPRAVPGRGPRDTYG